MSKAKKTALLLAVIFIVVGLAIAVSAFAAAGFHPASLSTLHYTEQTYDVDEPFTAISVQDVESDIHLVPAEGDSCRVVCKESEEIHHTVTVENGTLVIQRVDTRTWRFNLGFGFYWEPVAVTVYLPRGQYDSLKIQTLSGRVEVPADFAFDRADAYSASGAIDFAAQVQGSLHLTTISGRIEARGMSPETMSIQSTSGRISLSSANIAAQLSAETISGRIDMIGVQAGGINLNTTSGAIELTDVVARDLLHAQSVSGQIALAACDGGSVSLHTTSGRISGTLLSEKVFTASSISGRVDVPHAASGGPCEASSTSGSIILSIE